MANSVTPKQLPANSNQIDSRPPEPAGNDGQWQDNMIIRTVFFSLLGVVAATLWLDYTELRADIASVMPTELGEPVLPPIFRQPNGDQNPASPRTEAPQIITSNEELQQPMLMELSSDGRFELTGSITPGSAERFQQAVEKRGEYIKTIALNSPGGSVIDALEMSSLIREKKWTTEVSKGHLCASSCPLIFSGGTKRTAHAGAAIGVHQVFSTSDDNRSTPEAISGTQRLTARINRHLETMDVEPELWLHALETPPQNLYYLTSDELKSTKLATKIIATQ